MKINNSVELEFIVCQKNWVKIQKVIIITLINELFEDKLLLKNGINKIIVDFSFVHLIKGKNSCDIVKKSNKYIFNNANIPGYKND